MKNKIQLVGHLGSDPVVKNLSNDKKVLNISIAVAETYKNKEGEVVKETTWINCQLWNKTAELLEKFTKKGSFIMFNGSLKFDNYETKEGEKKTSCFVLVEDFLLLDKKEN